MKKINTRTHIQTHCIFDINKQQYYKIYIHISLIYYNNIDIHSYIYFDIKIFNTYRHTCILPNRKIQKGQL